MEEAASFPLVGLNAWQALIEKANLENRMGFGTRMMFVASCRLEALQT